MIQIALATSVIEPFDCGSLLPGGFALKGHIAVKIVIQFPGNINLVIAKTCD